ncbi:MAG: GIY-YIG nuclease family protein [Parvibaculaceae bacterium]
MISDPTYCVYILASRPCGALYVGVTSDLVNRVLKHRERVFDGHTSKYGITILVWYQGFARIEDAIAFEKRLKRWRRAWKIELVEKTNPDWRDLWQDVAGA